MMALSFNSSRWQRLSAGLIAAAVTLSQTPLAAHDMWIEPTSFLPQPGQIVGVRLRVGQDLIGDPLPLDSALVNHFAMTDGEGEKPIVRRAGADPAGLLRAAVPGLLIIGYRSNPSPITLSADKFNQYLKEEGLEAVAAERTRRHESAATARELFARCAKSLVWSGASTESQVDRRIGFTLELVAERNPYALRPGEDFPVHLIYENRPLPGALVVAINQLNPAEKLTARSDSDGKVRFRLHPGGMWLIKAVHMVPAPAGSAAEWASFWASLTFLVAD
jgi:uncharacterized GH25 family protein